MRSSLLVVAALAVFAMVQASSLDGEVLCQTVEGENKEKCKSLASSMSQCAVTDAGIEQFCELLPAENQIGCHRVLELYQRKCNRDRGQSLTDAMSKVANDADVLCQTLSETSRQKCDSFVAGMEKCAKTTSEEVDAFCALFPSAISSGCHHVLEIHQGKCASSLTDSNASEAEETLCKWVPQKLKERCQKAIHSALSCTDPGEYRLFCEMLKGPFQKACIAGFDKRAEVCRKTRTAVQSDTNEEKICGVAASKLADTCPPAVSKASCLSRYKDLCSGISGLPGDLCEIVNKVAAKLCLLHVTSEARKKCIVKASELC
jgi:hypothetical protein